MSDRTDLSRSFIPRLLVNHIANKLVEGEESLSPTSFFLQGACLLVDISGFTALSEGFCEAGKLGIDSLQVCTNGYIGKLVTIVHSHGGDIIKFAGDALVCIFTENKSPTGAKSRNFDSADVDVLIRAAKCAKEVSSMRTDTLTVHVGVSCGEICFGILGGIENRWECLISGSCIHELSQCLDDAPSMQVVVTAGFTSVLEDACARTHGQKTSKNHDGLYSVNLLLPADQYKVVLEPLPSGNSRLVDVSTNWAMHRPAPLDAFVGPVGDLTERQRLIRDALIRQFVPTPIVEELDAVEDLNYVAEIREVVTMFMKWDSYDANVKHRDLMELQPCFYQAQRILQSTGAYLRQFLVDDKGCVLIACWGMPNMSYLDNTQRAVVAAAQIKFELERLDMKTSVGITSADVYCGTVGSVERMEYAAIGSAVNMAARIMGKAKGRLLVSDPVFQSLPSPDRERLEAVEPMQVKGRCEPLQTHEYLPRSAAKATAPGASRLVADIPSSCKPALLSLLESLTAGPNSQSSRSHGSSVVMLGTGGLHSSRSSFFRNVSIPDLLLPNASHPAKLVLVKGKSGTGKSCVASWLRSAAMDRSIPVISTRVTRLVGRKTPYTLWKKIFHQIAANNHLRGYGTWTHVQELLAVVFPDPASLNEHISLTSLSAALDMGCTFANTTATVQSNQLRGSAALGQIVSPARRMPSEQQVREGTRDALVKVFVYLFKNQPTLLIVENVHLAGERCLDLLAHLVPKLSHPSAVVLTALVPDSLPPSVRAKETTYSAAAVQINAMENSPWNRKFHQVFLCKKAVKVTVLSSHTTSDIAAMLCKTLRLSVAPAELVQLVQDFSGGSYFWVNEILQFIKENGVENFVSAIATEAVTPMSQSGDSARAPWRQQSLAPQQLRRSISMAKNHHMPAPIVAASPFQAQLDKLILVRFGGLSTESQRILRTASIIGAVFSATVLHAVLPVQLQPELRSCLQSLVNQLWLQRDPENDELYIFMHAHAQEMIYELTPSSERNHLYALIAAHVEEKSGNDPACFTKLSQYFLHCDTHKALQYAAKAVTVLLEVHTIFDFADVVTLLQNSVQAVTSPADVVMVQQLCTQCHRAIQGFKIPQSCAGPSLPRFALWAGACWGRTRVEPCGPDEDKIEDNARAAQEEFCRQVEEVWAALRDSSCGPTGFAGLNATEK